MLIRLVQILLFLLFSMDCIRLTSHPLSQLFIYSIFCSSHTCGGASLNSLRVFWKQPWCPLRTGQWSSKSALVSNCSSLSVGINAEQLSQTLNGLLSLEAAWISCRYFWGCDRQDFVFYGTFCDFYKIRGILMELKVYSWNHGWSKSVFVVRFLATVRGKREFASLRPQLF